MTLTKAYKNEFDARVMGKILLIIRASLNKQNIESVVKELHRARSLAYKWYEIKDEGLEDLRDKPKSGKP